MSSALDLAAQVLAQVRAQLGGQVEAEAEVERQRLALTRFANSFIHQNVAEDTRTVRLRLHADGRTTAVASTITTSDGLAALVGRAIEAVKVAPPDPGWPGLAPATPLFGTGGFDQPTADADPAERASRVRAFVDTAGEAQAAGYCRTRHWSSWYANSAGQSGTGQTTEAALDGVARHEGCDGVARQAAVALADLDGAELGARAATKAHAGTGPMELPPGRYEVVLEPNAVVDLLHHLAMSGFNGKPYAQRRSFVTLGAAQFDPAVTLVDDPFAAGTPGLPIDAEGTPKRPLTLVDAGVTRAVTHDRRTAAQAGGGAQSTGHDLAGWRSFGPIATNLGLAPGRARPAPSEVGVADPAAAGLIDQVERGLLVTDFWYTRVLDPKSLVVTGLTRNGVWLIEDGRVTTPVQNLRFTQSYPLALAPGAVLGVGPVASVLPIGWGLAWRQAPALHLRAWHFTGGASG